jgi:TonB-dependent starch-binding outer membrane protein SusC
MKLTFIPVLRNPVVLWSQHRCGELLLKTVRVMKIMALLLFAACLHASATGFSQHVTLKADNMPLKQVLAKVKDQTGYSFFFKKGSLDQTSPVTVQVNNMPLAEFLDVVLKDQPLKYELSFKTITLIPKPVTAVTTGWQPKRYQEITGNIKGENDVPLSGASVKVKGTTIGTTSDAGGRFSIHVEPGQTLVISYIGYEDKQIKISNETSLTIQLKLNEVALDAVTVNKGYYTENRRLSTGNISTVKAEDIERQPVTNPLSAIQGRVPGMIITQSTGMPGSAFKVQIRGRNSIKAGLDPLYVVDGIPYSASLLNVMGGLTNDATLGGSPLNFINPQDIATIDILKDADATAIYGSRGANGVILITTKKGKAGKTQVTANVSQGFAKVAHKVKLLNTRQYLDLRYEGLKTDNQTLAGFYAAELRNFDTTRYTDWQKELLGGSASYTNAQLSMSGGTAATNYLIAGGYNRQTTVFPGPGSDQRASLYFNINTSSNNQKFRASLTGGYIIGKNDLPRYDPIDLALSLPPIAPALYNADGSLNWQNGNWVNPLGRYRARYSRKVNNVIGNMVLSYQLLKGLEIKSTFGYTYMHVDETNNFPSAMYNPALSVPGQAEFLNTNNLTWIIEPQASYTRDIWKGRLNVLIGSTIQQNRYNGMSVNATGFTSDALLGNLMSAGTITPRSSLVSSYKYNSVFGRFNYTLLHKYVVNLTMRRDGSDRFGPAKRFGNFGAIGASWIFSRENLIAEHLPFISFGKLRGSYGTTGNDGIGDFQFIRTYSVGGYTYQGVRGLSPDNLFNDDYAWEVNKKLEGGIEMGFFRDRVIITANYFLNRSDNQLVGYRIPAQTGFTGITDNWPAVVENKGWELMLNTHNIRIGQVAWNSYFNISITRNRLAKFPNIANTSYAQTLTVGLPLDMTRVFDVTGVDPATGNYVFLDRNGKSIQYPAYPSDPLDRTVLINRNPKYYGGFQNNVSYKGFELDFLFQFVKQVGPSFFGSVVPGAGSSTGGNQPVKVLNRWHKPGDVATFQNASVSNLLYWDYYMKQSDVAYSDASFIRLKNVQLAYDFSSNINKRIGLQQLRIYVQAQNLFTITHYDGMDPENQSAFSLPPLRVLTAGIKLTL